jgi:hypothetical protein
MKIEQKYRWCFFAYLPQIKLLYSLTHIFIKIQKYDVKKYFVLFSACLTNWLNFCNILITIVVKFLHPNVRQFPFNGN